jgi:DNA-binding transcriptional MerR regulator
MLTIGDFARHGRVSVRMLRHYDAIGLLRPAYVDRVTGYCSYDAGQLSRLNRIVALKGLRFTLQQAQSILDEEVSAIDNVMPTIQTSARWIDANGYRSVGYNRELYIECGENRDAWVKELQEPISTS